MREHEAIESVFVTGLADDRLDEAIGAVVILNPGAGASEADLKSHCRRSLAAYKVPRHFVFVTANELPMTSTEKLQRNRLHELFAQAEGA